MRFSTMPSRSGYLLLGITLAAGLGATIMGYNAVQQVTPAALFTASIITLFALIIALVALYHTIVVFSMHYHLNRNGLTIRYGVRQQRIPLKEIQFITPAQSVSSQINFRGINILGLYLGYGRLAGHGPLVLHGTSPFRYCTLVVTPERTYVISPAEITALIHSWRACQEIGSTQEWSVTNTFLPPFDIPLLNDGLAWGLLAAGLMLLVALVGAISLNYAELPAALPVHFDNLGRADRIEPKIFLYTLPAVGAVVWLVNLLAGVFIYRREQLGAYLLWGSTAAIQVSLWVALFTIISP
jgi:uncharacterized membrane protein